MPELQAAVGVGTGAGASVGVGVVAGGDTCLSNNLSSLGTLMPWLPGMILQTKGNYQEAIEAYRSSPLLNPLPSSSPSSSSAAADFLASDITAIDVRAVVQGVCLCEKHNNKNTQQYQ